MNTKFSPVCLSIVFVVILSCLFNTAEAQKRSNRILNYEGDPAGFSGGGGFGGADAQWGVSLQLGYDSPQGDFAKSYKGAPLIGISILKYTKKFTFGLTVSRHSNKPAVDSIVETFPGDIYGTQTIRLTNNKFTGIYSSGVYNIDIADNFKCYGGVNLGVMFSSYNIFMTDAYGSYTGTYKDSYGYFAPKLGVEVAVSNGFSIGIEGKYNIFIQGSTDKYSSGGPLSSITSVATAATLTYSF